MKVMILAAGRGERMRPLTDTCPKPLLDVAGTPLIGWHLKRLAAAGLTDIVINHAWLGDKIEAALGNGATYGVKINYSPEEKALETAGGIARALPLLGDEPFAVVNGDIFTDFDFARLASIAAQLPTGGAHLVMVPKAGYPTGRDLTINSAGLAQPCGADDTPLTFAGIAVYHPTFFAGLDPNQPAPLLPLFLTGMAQKQICGETFTGFWLDVGTSERLEAARAHVFAHAQAKTC